MLNHPVALITAFAKFYISYPTVASFKLTTWCHLMQAWEEMLIVTSHKLSSSIPMPWPHVFKFYLQPYLLFLHQIRLKVVCCTTPFYLYASYIAILFMLLTKFGKLLHSTFTYWTPHQLCKAQFLEDFPGIHINLFYVIFFCGLLWLIPNVSFSTNKILNIWSPGSCPFCQQYSA